MRRIVINVTALVGKYEYTVGVAGRNVTALLGNIATPSPTVNGRSAECCQETTA